MTVLTERKLCENLTCEAMWVRPGEEYLANSEGLVIHRECWRKVREGFIAALEETDKIVVEEGIRYQVQVAARKARETFAEWDAALGK